MKLFSEEYRRRERWFRYAINPWISLLALVTAVILTVIYDPPLVGCIFTVVVCFAGGICVAYGPLSSIPWIEKYSFLVAFLTTFFVTKHYALHSDDGGFFALLAWTMFGIAAPFWIWRSRGMETFGPPAAPKAK